MPSAQVPFIVLRTALDSIGTFAAWGDLPATLPYTDKIEALRARFRLLVDRPEVREALWLASPDLHEAIRHGLPGPETDKGERIERALVRYLSRLCGRSTPFGLFAGTSLGTVGTKTRFELKPATSYRRRSRLDMAFLQALARHLAKDASVRAELVFRPNPDLYEFAGALRYAEIGFQRAIPTYRLITLETTAHLLEALRRAEPGAGLGAIAQGLENENVSREEAFDFVLRLVEAQILVPDLPPPLTGPEPIHYLSGQCRAMAATASVATSLEEVAVTLARHDASPLGARLSKHSCSR